MEQGDLFANLVTSDGMQSFPESLRRVRQFDSIAQLFHCGPNVEFFPLREGIYVFFDDSILPRVEPQYSTHLSNYLPRSLVVSAVMDLSWGI